MGQALYRKYRSKKLSEIVGQEHITRTLENALKTGKLSHAYLFTGPRGVGKTSIARILAHEINQLPYSEESTHLDIIEIDAASNRGVEDIRSLREKVHVAPTSSKYKVYIIDEAHMLTKEAFNALLKTLEEPPAHVVFILATTELHKMPETIVSRTQRFAFKSIEKDAAVEHLRSIAKQEGMEIDDEALELLAIHGRGSFRDSISLLDQVGHSAKKITRADAEKLIGLPTSEHITSLLKAVQDGSPSNVLSVLDKLIEDGISPAQAAKQLAAALRREIIANQGDKRTTELLGNLLEVGASTDPGGKLEVVLLRSCMQTPVTHPVAAIVESAKPIVTQLAPSNTETSAEDVPEGTKTPSEEPAPNEAPMQSISGEIADWWDEVLVQIKSINNTLYGAMRMATPRIDGDTLHLGFKFGLHAKKASEATTQAKLVDAIKAVTGKAYQINAVVDKTLGTPQPAAQVSVSPTPSASSENNSAHLDSVKNIFGGAEVLES